MVKQGITRENREDYKDLFENLITSGVRVIVMATYYRDTPVIFEYLYDLGIRRNDMVFLAVEWLSVSNFYLEDEERQKKVRELQVGALQYFPASWIGEFGHDISKRYEQAYGFTPDLWSAFFYDSVLAVATTFDWMMTSGKEFENPYEFRKQWFDMRLTGTTGVMSFDDHSNDRSPMDYAI